MSESELIRYLRKNRKKFTMDQLRRGLLAQGTDAAELEAAIIQVSSEKSSRLPWIFVAAVGGALVSALLYRLGSSRTSSSPAAAAAPAASPSPLPASGELPGGIAAAREAYRRNFFDPTSHVALAEALYRSGRAVDSFYILEEARGLFPEQAFDLAHQFVVIGKGKGGWGLGPFDPSPEHEAELYERLKSDPRDWEALGYLAHIEGSRQDEGAALAHVDKALELAPLEPRLLAFKGFLLLRKKDFGGTFVVFDKVAGLAPDSPDGRSAIDFIGKLAQSKGEKELGDLPDRALKSLETVLQNHPDNAAAFSALAFAHWARGEMPVVRDMVKRTLASHPNHAGAEVIQGALAIEDKQVDAAIPLLRKALETDPDNEYALEKLAHIFRAEKGDPEGALPYYMALHHLNPHFNDGEYAESRIKDWLQRRRDAVLTGVRPEQLSAFFASEDGALRAEACLRAAKFGDPKLIEPLIGLLDDDVGNVTQNADYALFQIGKADPRALLNARDKMLNSPRVFIRGIALGIFSDLAPKETLPVAIGRLKDPEPYVRFRAASGLKHYYAADPEAQRALEAFLASEKDQRLLATLRYIDKDSAQQEKETQEGKKFMSDLTDKDPVLGGAAKAAILLDAKDFPAAIEEYQKTLELNKKAQKLTKTDLGMVYSGLGDAYLFSGRNADALVPLDRASKLLEGAGLIQVHVLFNLACACSAERKLSEADAALRSCLKAAQKAGALKHFAGQAKKDSQLANLRKGRSFAKLLASFGH